MAGICKKQKIFVHEIGGMEDHIHMLIEIPLTLAHSEAIQEIKTSSSRWGNPPEIVLASSSRPYILARSA